MIAHGHLEFARSASYAIQQILGSSVFITSAFQQMRIGILSDTHDQRSRARYAAQRLKDEGATILFHCGDLIEASMIAECSVLPCYFVFGNNDADSVPEIRKAIAETEGAVCLAWGGEVPLESKRIAMTHGHLRTDVRRLLAGNPDYLLTGHSHLRSDTIEGKTRRINPGALHRAREFSVALLDLENDELRFLIIPSVI